jgi:hypothetical protein
MQIFGMPDSIVLKVVLVILLNAANAAAIWATGLTRKRSRAINETFDSGPLDRWSEQLAGKWWALRVIVWLVFSAWCMWMEQPMIFISNALLGCLIAFRSVQQLNKRP